MDPLAPFAQRTRTFCEVVSSGGQMPLEGRVLTIHAALSAVLAAATALPVHPGKPPSGSGPFPDDWPGFGDYEGYWTVGPLSRPHEPVPTRLSQTLRFVFDGLWGGLERYEAGDLPGAAGTWSLGFEDTWGPAATELTLALQPAVAGYRRDKRPLERKPRTVDLVTLQAPRRPPPVALGVDFAVSGGALIVSDVHPDGPSAGHLVPGDAVLTVDGLSPAELDPDAVVALLRPPSGQPRRFEVFREGETVVVTVVSG